MPDTAVSFSREFMGQFIGCVRVVSPGLVVSGIYLESLGRDLV